MSELSPASVGAAPLSFWGRFQRHSAVEFPQSPFLSFPVLWRNVTFLLALVTFISLLITRELDPATTILFPSLLFGAWLIKSPPRFWRSWMAYIITTFVILVLARLAYTEYFRTLLRLLLFLLLFKCFTLRSSRDFLQAQILCFFILVATAVITVTFLFSFVFPLYLLLEVLALILYSLGKKREEIKTGLGSPGASSVARRDLGVVPSRFLGTGFISSGLVMLLVIFYFYLIPHYSLQKLDAPLAPRRSLPNPTAVSGFGEDVKLGDFKKIEPDGTVVMRVELDLSEEGAEAPQFLRMRGVVLDIYENNRWRRNSSGNFQSRNSLLSAIEIQPISVLNTRPLAQKIYQNPDITLRIFGATHPRKILFEENVWGRRDPWVSTYQATQPGKPGQRGFTDPFVYEVLSAIAPSTSDFLPQHIDWQRQNPGRRVDPRYSLRGPAYFNNTRLPEEPLIGEIRQLSTRVAPGATDAQKVQQLLSYLNQNYEYTLEPDTPDGVDPIRAFLFQTRKGHCEFFATAMVLMLRSQGVPSRMVNGFYTTDWNPAAGVFVVKQSDAHSWAEVWLDGIGWVTVDPTPAASAGSGAYPTIAGMGGTPVREYLRMWWQRNVIDFTTAKQASLYKGIAQNSVFKAFESAGAALLGRVASATGGQVVPEGGGRALAFTVTLVIVVFFLVLLFRAVLSLLSFRARQSGMETPPIDYFTALLRKLEKLGLRREESQTPQELIESARNRLAGSDQLQWIIDLYYAERFRGERAGPDDRRAALRIIADLSKASPGEGS